MDHFLVVVVLPGNRIYLSNTSSSRTGAGSVGDESMAHGSDVGLRFSPKVGHRRTSYGSPHLRTPTDASIVL